MSVDTAINQGEWDAAEAAVVTSTIESETEPGMGAETDVEPEIEVVSIPPAAVRRASSKWSHVEKYMAVATNVATDAGTAPQQGALYQLKGSRTVLQLRAAVKRATGLFPGFGFRIAPSIPDGAKRGAWLIIAVREAPPASAAEESLVAEEPRTAGAV